MSRIGNMPVVVPDGVSLIVGERCVEVSGPKGVVAVNVCSGVCVEVKGPEVKIAVSGNSRSHQSLHGLYRSIINNAVTGVVKGFEKKLELSGVGYQAQIKGGNVELFVGYSKPVVFSVPRGISVSLTDSTHVVVSGIDKQAVGQFAATLRSSRVPDPYKAKGVKYFGEVVKRKAGKAFGAGAK